MHLFAAIAVLVMVIAGFGITFWHFDGNLFDPLTWPVPQFDKFYIGLGAYYDKFIADNGKMFPIIGWAVYLLLNTLSIHLPAMEGEKQSIPNLIKVIFTGKADEKSSRLATAITKSQKTPIVDIVDNTVRP